MKLPTSTGSIMACIAVLASCARTPQFPDVPPHIVEECRREAALLAEPPWLEPNDPMGSGQETGDVIEDARTAESEAEGTGLTGWPREVLLYRCLAGRGATLTTEQARTLAEWERRLEQGRAHFPPGGVISRLFSGTKLRSFCLAGQKMGPAGRAK